jgi:hypothetical protein
MGVVKVRVEIRQCGGLVVVYFINVRTCSLQSLLASVML